METSSSSHQAARRSLGFIGLVVVSAVNLCATAILYARRTQDPRTEFEDVSVRRICVRDNAGREVIMLGMDEQGRPAVILRDAGGVIRMKCGLEPVDRGSLKAIINDEYYRAEWKRADGLAPQVAMFDGAGARRLVVGELEHGFGLNVRDVVGALRMSVGTEWGRGEPTVDLLGANGKLWAQLRIWYSGGQLRLASQDEQHAARIITAAGD
jgi:hypothetical protein